MDLIMGIVMEIKRKDNKMLKRILDEIYLIVLLILLLILASGSLHAQVWDAPSGYTDYAGLRLYATGANAGSDSLNQNLIDIDSLLDAHQDTLDAIKADLYGISDYAGGYKDATIAWADLSSAAKSNIVQTSGTQNIAGSKTFTDGMYTDGIYPNTSDTYNIGKKEEKYNRSYFNYVTTGALIIEDATAKDSLIILYDGDNMTIDKNITFDDTTKTIGSSTLQLNAIYTDSVKSPNDLILDGNHIIMQGIFGIGGGTLSSHTIGATDSVTIVPTSSFVYLNTTAPTSVSYISPLAITPGLIYIITTDGVDAVTLLDNTGNLSLNGNFVMDAESDVIVLMKSGTTAGQLIELFRSNND